MAVHYRGASQYRDARELNSFVSNSNPIGISEGQFDKGMGIYEGTQRSLKLTGAAFDTVRERFTVVGKQGKAYGAGIKAATEFEKVKGDYLDYQGQLETNEQKQIGLGISQHKTTTDRTAAVHTTASLDEKLKQAEIAAELTRAIALRFIVRTSV
jgi:hypothetical protein